MAQHPNFAALLPAVSQTWRADIARWLAYDLPKPVHHAHAHPSRCSTGSRSHRTRACTFFRPRFDYGGFVVGSAPRTARLLGKSPGVLAGVPFVDEVFRQVGGCTVTWHRAEGSVITEADARAKRCVATVAGPADRLLQGERTALNVLSRASGVATAARRCADIAARHGWHGSVAGTRKTTPGFAVVEKYALLVGGGATHRMDLSAMLMLKDNHIWSNAQRQGAGLNAGGAATRDADAAAVAAVTDCVRHAKRATGFSTKLEVECRSLEEAFAAGAAGADVVMLDNFGPEGLKKVAAQVKARYPHLVIEASGGITADTMAAFFSPHVDVISQGKLTHGYGVLDFSLKIDRGVMAARL